jgi:hypothetical protein
MKKTALLFAASLAFLMSCRNEEKEETKEMALPADSAQSTAAVAAETGARSFAVRPGINILFTESHPNGMSMSDVAVVVQGVPDAQIMLHDIDVVMEILEGDLDKNGSAEWYIISQAGGSGSYGSIKGIVLMENDMPNEILVPDMNAGEGYQGHDRFSIAENKLIRQFPIYKSGDNNSNPTGGEKTVRYILKQFPGGGKYFLEAEPQ